MGVNPSFPGGLPLFDQLFYFLAAFLSDFLVELMAVPLFRHVAAAAARFLYTYVSFGFFYCHNITKYYIIAGYIDICHINYVK